MRNGILELLPDTLPEGQLVLVIAPEEYPGLNAVKSDIQRLNRGKAWIRAEYRRNASEDLVSNKVGLVITTVGVSRGSLQKIRSAAERLGICCPNQAFTMAETKDAVELMSQRRQGMEQANQPSNLNGLHNGNGSHPAVQQAGGDAPPAEGELLSCEQPEEPINPEEAPEVEDAFAALADFQPALTRVQDALFTLGERLKTVTEERDSISQELLEKCREISALQDKAAQADKLVAENQRLQADNARLRSALAGVDAAVKTARAGGV